MLCWYVRWLIFVVFLCWYVRWLIFNRLDELKWNLKQKKGWRYPSWIFPEGRLVGYLIIAHDLNFLLQKNVVCFTEVPFRADAWNLFLKLELIWLHLRYDSFYFCFEYTGGELIEGIHLWEFNLESNQRSRSRKPRFLRINVLWIFTLTEVEWGQNRIHSKVVRMWSPTETVFQFKFWISLY